MRANDPCSGAVIHHTTSQYQREYQTNTKDLYLEEETIRDTIISLLGIMHCFSWLDSLFQKTAASEKTLQ